MQQARAWLRATIHHPPQSGEAVTELLFEEGAQGLWEDQPDALGRLVTRAGFNTGDRDRLEKFLPAMLDRVAEAFGLSESDFEFSLDEQDDQDWAEKWKEGLAPVVVNENLAVFPTWWSGEDWPEGLARSAKILRLDPGLAFGSGHHATTWLCLKALGEWAPAARRVLDVGSGSGILALAAAALTPTAEIAGVDNDPDTVSVAEENAAANGLAGRIYFSARELGALTPPYDLIVANITMNPLLDLAGPVSGLAGPGGRLVLSGLLESQAATAAEAYAALGWGLERHLGREEWSALVFIKDAPGRRAEREIF